MRSPENEKHRPIRDLLRRLIKAPAALSILWPALLLVAGYAAWHRWGSDHVAQKYSGIDPTLIQVTDPPPFVRTSIVKSVYRETSMDNLSLLDRQAASKIASAFSMHPWVRNVVSVRKLPGGVIDVRLDYRTPVAMVHVFKPDPTDTRSYFFPVDGDGVLLPTTEFAQAETRQFIHIEVPGVYSNNAVGTPFGDPRVESAARIAEVLAPYREEAGIVSIGLHGELLQNDVPQFELITSGGSTFIWGSPPGKELAGELPVRMKIRALLADQQSSSTDLRIANPLSGLHRQ